MNLINGVSRTVQYCKEIRSVRNCLKNTEPFRSQEKDVDTAKLNVLHSVRIGFIKKNLQN